MNFGKITVITPPDKLFNLTTSYLLIKPGIKVKQQLQTILSKSFDDINVFIFDENETDIGWMLSTADQVDSVIIDIDNCDSITRQFVTYLIAHSHVHYITSDELTPYNLISRNRIYNLDEIIEDLENEENQEEDE